MMENRFNVDGDKELSDAYCWQITDEENDDLTYGDVADLLNNLCEENEQLKNCLNEDDLTIADLMNQCQELNSTIVHLTGELDYYKPRMELFENELNMVKNEYYQYRENVTGTLMKKYNHYHGMQEILGNNRDADRIYNNILKVLSDIIEDLKGDL